VTIEQAIQTQRSRLLRLVAGLLVVLGFLSVGPVSRSFSDWACGYVSSILSRAELAARYLVIAQARRIVVRRGVTVDFRRVLEECAFDTREGDLSLSDCIARLRVLQRILRNLSHHALRLIRWIEKRTRAACTDQAMPRPNVPLSASLQNWQLAKTRVERPPDIVSFAPPSIFTSLRFPGGRRRPLCVSSRRAEPGSIPHS